MTYTTNQASTANFIPENELSEACIGMNIDGVPGGKCNSIAIGVFTESLSGEVAAYQIVDPVEVLELICAIAPALSGGELGEDPDLEPAMNWILRLKAEGLSINDIFAILQNESQSLGFLKDDLIKIMCLAAPGTEMFAENNNIPEYVLEAIADYYWCRPHGDQDIKDSATMALQALLIATRYLNQ